MTSPKTEAHPHRPLPRPLAFMWRRKEGTSTLLMGAAAVVTAWCAFEATKWSGIQSIRFAQAAAARTESSRDELTQNQLTIVDVSTFLAWVEAVNQERQKSPEQATVPYHPDPAALSGFLFNRLRPEFRVAVQAWVATRPLVNPDAPPTPFAMDAYERPLAGRAASLEKEADEKVKAGRDANATGDNYTLVTVFSSLVIFFAGMSAKLEVPLNGVGLYALALIAFVACLVAISRLPVVVF